MTKTQTLGDITIRGGTINVPLPTAPTQPIRHQPDTPRTKKVTTPRADHQLAADATPPVIPDAPPADPPLDDTPKDEPVTDPSD